MRAVVVPTPGGPEQLVWGHAPDVEPGPGEVRIAVAASAVNRADTYQRAGRYPIPPGVSPILGLECSGTIDTLGTGVDGWSVGDRVCALLVGGGYAEHVVVPAGQVLPVPAGVDLVAAAALPEVACTVWSNLVMTAGLTSGDVVLVHGGASGIGTFASQLGRALGARVLVTAGSATRVERCLSLGAEAGFDHTSEDFVEGARAATDGRGVDVVLDNMGASYLARNLAVLADDGRLVTIGLQGGNLTEIDLRPMLLRRLSLHVTTLRSRSVAAKSEVVAQVREHVWPLVAGGQVRPVVDRVVPMEQAAQAHRHLESGTHIGKIVLSTTEENDEHQHRPDQRRDQGGDRGPRRRARPRPGSR